MSDSELCNELYNLFLGLKEQEIVFAEKLILIGSKHSFHQYTAELDSEQLIQCVFEDMKFNWGRLATVLAFIFLADAISDKNKALLQLAKHCVDFFGQTISDLGGKQNFITFLGLIKI